MLVPGLCKCILKKTQSIGYSKKVDTLDTAAVLKTKAGCHSHKQVVSNRHQHHSIVVQSLILLPVNASYPFIAIVEQVCFNCINNNTFFTSKNNKVFSPTFSSLKRSEVFCFNLNFCFY